MAETNQQRWDERYRAAAETDAKAESRTARPPSSFVDHEDLLAAAGTAIELACGAGAASVWLAMQGVSVRAYDVSPVAIAQATAFAQAAGVAERCSFAVADFDDGLPPGEPVDLILCHLFRDCQLDDAIVDRLATNGVLAIAALSEVGAEPGRFRAKPGELVQAFGALEFIAGNEADGVAWLLARKI